MVAFVEQLPTLTPPAYAALIGEPAATWLPNRSAGMVDFDPAPCAMCHGVDGLGRGAVSPIAGRRQTDLEAALLGYRDGSRPSGFMQPYAATLSDRQIAEAARYYAGLPGDPP